jgi:hypothetical protein
MYQLALVLGTGSSDTLGNDLPLLSDAPLKPFFVFVIDVVLFGGTKPARALLARDLVVSVPPRSSLCSLFQRCHSPMSIDGSRVRWHIVRVIVVWLMFVTREHPPVTASTSQRMAQHYCAFLSVAGSSNNGSRIGAGTGAASTSIGIAASLAFAAIAFLSSLIVRYRRTISSS